MRTATAASPAGGYSILNLLVVIAGEAVAVEEDGGAPRAVPPSGTTGSDV